MSALTENQLEQKAGKRFRLVVRSAEEAVRVIREKLGEDARVFSVKQVGGEGLKRFISSPKLEVIAEIPSAEQKELSESRSLEEGSTPAVSDPAEVGVLDEGVPRVDSSQEQKPADSPSSGRRRTLLIRLAKRNGFFRKPASIPICFPKFSLGPIGKVFWSCLWLMP